MAESESALELGKATKHAKADAAKRADLCKPVKAKRCSQTSELLKALVNMSAIWNFVLM